MKLVNSVQDEKEQLTIDEEEKKSNDEDSDEDKEEFKGLLTTVESTCMLSNMISKLTLIHEATSRPLPFVDESISQKFLKCHKTRDQSIEINETDDIKTLDQCLQRYFKPEILSGENLFDCFYCRSLDQIQSRIVC